MLECIVNGVDGSRIKWSRIGGSALPYTAVDSGNGRLSIQRLSVDDSGEYICSIDDRPEVNQNFYIYVKRK